MDIWEWFTEERRRLLREGNARLAAGLSRLPSLVCADRHAEVDALVPGLLAEARELSLPWLEVYVRHWHLQSRVLHRMEGDSALADAVSLLDFSHQEGNKGCPQSVCTVQDLAACYALTDGPGFAQERLDVARETLARIDASWACYTCIASEYADALLDQDRAEETAAFLDKLVADRLSAGDKDALWTAGYEQKMVLLTRSSRFEELLSFVSGCERQGRNGPHEEIYYRIMRARALAGLGRTEEAKTVLPKASEVEPTPSFYPRWTEAARAIGDAEGPSSTSPHDSSEANASAPESRLNVPELGRQLTRFAQRLLRQGVYRHSLHIAEHAGYLALLRGAAHAARRAALTMQKACSKLRAPLDALDRIAKLERAIAAAAPPEPLPATAEEVLARVQSDPKGEAMTGLLERATKAWPASAEIVIRYAEALDFQGFEEEARDELRGALVRITDSRATTEIASLLATRAPQAEALEIADQRMAAGAELHGLMIKAEVSARLGDFEACKAHSEAMLARDRRHAPALRLCAKAARETGDFNAMLAAIEELLPLDPAPKLRWDHILAATLTGAWDAARRSSSELGIQLWEGEGPLHLMKGSLCQIRYMDRDALRELYALRTGPVTARILEISPPGAPSRVEDLVAFDASPLNTEPATDEEKKTYCPLYAHVATLEKGDFAVYEIQGVHPSEETWKEVRATLERIQVVSQTEATYALAHPESGATLEGLIGLIALPKSVPPALAHQTLTLATTGLAHPLVWPLLARAASDDEAAENHAAIADAWGFLGL